MPRIRCRYIDCYYIESGFCTAENVIIDPDEGCLTYSHIDDISLSEPEDWQLDEIEDIDDLDEVWDDGEGDEEETEDWIEDDAL
jgi:hypothetical protein